jgi:hypothetical protein
MSYIVQVFLKNPSFSEEYAAENHEGKDSPENIRFEWEDEFAIRGEFSDVETKRYEEYTLSGEQGEDKPFHVVFKDVFIFHFISKEGITPLVFPEAAVDEYVLNRETKRLKVYLNDKEQIENPIPGIYLFRKDFPKELRD